jgi:TrmH family RNA methyltransferase
LELTIRPTLVVRVGLCKAFVRRGAHTRRSIDPLKPLKWYKRLATKKGRRESGFFLVEGERTVRQVIASHPDMVLEIVTSGEPSPSYRTYTTHVLDERRFRSISQTKTPQGTLAVVRLPREAYSSILPANLGIALLLLEDIQDPGNVGTLIRTAAAFDFSGIILTPKCADPFSPKSVQATAGSVLSVWLRRTNRYLELVEVLKNKGFSLAAADLNGLEDATMLCRRNKLVLALGNEASGLSNALIAAADSRFKIPIARRKAESLNVAACGAICMYLSSRKP